MLFLVLFSILKNWGQIYIKLILNFIYFLFFLLYSCESENVRSSVVSDSLGPHGLQPTRFPCPWDSPGKSTGVACHFLLHNFKAYNSVTFSAFVILCNHHIYQDFSSFRTCLSHQRKTLYPLSGCSPSPMPSGPWKPPLCSLSVRINLPWMLHINGIMSHTSFHVRLLSLSRPWSFMHTVTCISTSFLFMGKLYSIVCVYHNLFIQSTVEGL